MDYTSFIYFLSFIFGLTFIFLSAWCLKYSVEFIAERYNKQEKKVPFLLALLVFFLVGWIPVPFIGTTISSLFIPFAACVLIYSYLA